MKALVIEGDRKAAARLAGILGEAGHETRTSLDGTEGFHAYQEMQPDLVLIDWTMAGISGTELCRIIRDYNLKTGKVSYIILTALKSEDLNMVSGLDAGADDFILKPFSKAVVLSRVEVARRVLETKFNKIPKVAPLKDRTIEPVETLNREHVMIHKMTGILEMVGNMLGEGRPLPKKLLTWAASSAFMLNWDLHEEKELFYVDLFIERARDVHGKTGQLYSRSSLSQILEEHETIKSLLLRMQDAAKAYNIHDPRTAEELRDIIARYLPLIRFHAAREEDVFLPFSQRYLTPVDVERIMKDFGRIDGEVGAKAVEKRMETLEQLERVLNIREKAV